MDNPGDTLTLRQAQDNAAHGLEESDLKLLSVVQESLLSHGAGVPAWGETDAGALRMFHDQVRQLLRPHVPPTKLEDAAARLADSLCGIGLLEQFLRQPDIEEVYVRHGEVAIERGGRLERGIVRAPDAYWESLVKRVADQRGQAISPRHRAVLVTCPPVNASPACSNRFPTERRSTSAATGRKRWGWRSCAAWALSGSTKRA